VGSRTGSDRAQGDLELQVLAGDAAVGQKSEQRSEKILKSGRWCSEGEAERYRGPRNFVTGRGKQRSQGRGGRRYRASQQKVKDRGGIGWFF